jgi:hypothetical protein
LAREPTSDETVPFVRFGVELARSPALGGCSAIARSRPLVD